MPRDTAGLAAYVEHFRARVLQDALATAHRAYLLRRAEQFEASRPCPDDFHGQATREDLSRRWRELTEVANAFRNAAAVAPMQTEVISPEAIEATREAA